MFLSDLGHKEDREAERTTWRHSRWLALAEFALVALVFWADARHLIPLSKTPFLLLLGWGSLRLRGLRWKDVGLFRSRSWLFILLIGAAAGIAFEAFQLLVTQPALGRLLGFQPDLSEFKNVTGNWKLAGIYVALSWTLAAFGEEMVWRGYLLNRVAGSLGRVAHRELAKAGDHGRAVWIVSVLLVNLTFGYAHDYQGLAGIITESIAGLLLTLLYLYAKRNLWLPIIAHGMEDTMDFILIYFGKMPGM